MSKILNPMNSLHLNRVPSGPMPTTAPVANDNIPRTVAAYRDHFFDADIDPDFPYEPLSTFED